MVQHKASKSAPSMWSEADVKELLDRSRQYTAIITTTEKAGNVAAGEHADGKGKQQAQSIVKTETKVDWESVASHFSGRTAGACASKYRQLNGLANGSSRREKKPEALVNGGTGGERQQMRTRLSVQAEQRPLRAAASASRKRIRDAITNGKADGDVATNGAKRMRISNSKKAVAPSSSSSKRLKSNAPKRVRPLSRAITVVGRKVGEPPRHKRAKGVRQAAKYIMRWSENDRKKLNQLQKKYGRNWKQIAGEMPGRSGRSCYMHWYNSNRRKRS